MTGNRFCRCFPKVLKKPIQLFLLRSHLFLVRRLKKKLNHRFRLFLSLFLFFIVRLRNNIWNTPYLFNAKEFDEETGLYYYGARYYDPRLSLWTSVDPLSGIAPNYSGYRYCFDNPTKFVDLLGLFETISQAKEYRAMNGIKGRIPKNEDGTYSINPIHSARFKKK